MDNIVIGVEGQVSAGKTSACKELIKLIDNCIFIDGGSIARAIVLAIANSNYDFQKNGDVSNIDPFEFRNFLIAINASIIFILTSTAISVLITVASIATPCSVKAYGKLLILDIEFCGPNL